MAAHHDSPLLQKATCRAISQFAFNSERNRKFLFEANAVPLIMRAVRTHISADKLVSHALVALTYLCWENGTVAEAILSEGADDLLKQISKQYENNDKVFNKAAHLAKILVRKAQSPSSRSPLPGTESPDFGSPMPIRDDQPTPFHGAEDGPMSPLSVERDKSFYKAPQDKDEVRPKRSVRGGMYDMPKAVYAEDLPEERNARGRGGRGGYDNGRGRSGGRGRGRGGMEMTNPDDLWDTPSTFHVAKGTNLNWQQQQLQEQQQQQPQQQYQHQYQQQGSQQQQQRGNDYRGQGRGGDRGGYGNNAGARGGRGGSRNDFTEQVPPTNVRETNSTHTGTRGNRGRGSRGGPRGGSFTVRGN
eukprot:GDKK01047465.1.p1 GENE.GDKK01047465.1~~GDKK01047465.1.p1  ORF type:complete len:388 (-),score=33.35 GDKK01047465.1:84-1160(-)